MHGAHSCDNSTRPSTTPLDQRLAPHIELLDTLRLANSVRLAECFIKCCRCDLRDYRCGAGVGVIGDGSAVWPIKNRSAPAAAARPSAMAQTINDCPRPMSPATKTPGTEVSKLLPRATLPRSVNSTPRSVNS